MNYKRPLKTIITLAVLVALTTGMLTMTASAKGKHGATKAHRSTASVQQVATTAINYDDAADIALGHIGEGFVVRVEQKYSRHGGSHTKVCINSDNMHYDVHIYPDGRVFTAKAREIVYTSSRANGSTSPIGFDSAAKIAMEHAGGGTIIKNELHYKHREDMLIHKVDVVIDQTEHKYEIDATSGNIIKYKTKTWW